MKRVIFGRIHADQVTFGGAVQEIARLIEARQGGYVVTPNVDHVVLAEDNVALQRAYADASLALADGMPLLWLSQLMGEALPAKVSGSDLIEPLMATAAERRWRVYFLGGAPGVGEAARAKLLALYPGLEVCGIDAPPIAFEVDVRLRGEALARLSAARPDLVLVALGCPKQELLMQAWRDDIAPAVAIGVGASLDFVAGTKQRAPRWMSQAGLEWLHRLSQEPGRLWRRYLVRDLAFAGIAWRMLRTPVGQRSVVVEEGAAEGARRLGG